MYLQVFRLPHDHMISLLHCLNFSQNYGEKQSYRCLETLLISIHNIEISDTEHTRKPIK